jgi:hypothetical protein
VLTTNEKEHPDLFFGIRGGGSNFGVVAEFVLQLHPQRRTVYAGMAIFAPSALEKIVSTTTEWWPKAGEKESMLQITTVRPDGNVGPSRCDAFLVLTEGPFLACHRPRSLL